jgi:tetratricopeptide (TPR) repeat protein
MKNVFYPLALIFMFIPKTFFAQINRYYKFSEFNYQPLDLDLLMKAGAAMQARYDNNKEYRDNLIDWIFDIKSKTSDEQLLSSLDNYYSQLRAFDGENFGKLGSELDRIKYGIKEEIDKYNTRIKDEPRRMYESAVNNLISQNYSQAINEFTDLINYDKECLQCYLGRGIAYYNNKNYQNSIKDLNKYIDTKDDEPTAFYYRGWAKYYQNNFIEALSDFNKEVEINPTSTAYYDRGSAKSALGDNFGAISDYSKAIELKPDFSMAYNNRGWAKFEQKKYSEALIDLNKAIELDNDNWVAYDSRQETKFAMNDLKGCIEDCDMAISINPKVSNSYFFRGRAFYKQGKKQNACEDWSKAGELGKKDAYEYISKYCKY